MKRTTLECYRIEVGDFLVAGSVGRGVMLYADASNPIGIGLRIEIPPEMRKVLIDAARILGEIARKARALEAPGSLVDLKA